MLIKSFLICFIAICFNALSEASILKDLSRPSKIVYINPFSSKEIKNKTSKNDEIYFKDTLFLFFDRNVRTKVKFF